MSELINNREERIKNLKGLMEKISSEDSGIEVREEISKMLKAVPYDEVIAAEQELFEDGKLKDNMLELCDLHSQALNGLLTVSNLKAPAGHPVSIFRKENQAIKREISFLQKLFNEINEMSDDDSCSDTLLKIHSHFNNLMDIEKHYLRKEYQLFPYLEKYNISGPSTVMWGKHDQIRGMLKNSIEALKNSAGADAASIKALIEIVFQPALKMIDEMIYKEENILFPMALDTLNEKDWYEILNQSDEIGYCLFEPVEKWEPQDKDILASFIPKESSKVKMPSGAMTVEELTNVLNTLPFDMTFVDKNDHVRYFTEGSERIFQRNKAILGRKVQFCHPPSSVGTVERILNDFKSGKENKAAFWINMKGKFIYISYYAVRDKESNYLGTLEVTQDLTELRSLEGERRILEYDQN